MITDAVKRKAPDDTPKPLAVVGGNDEAPSAEAPAEEAAETSNEEA
jgi:hypothetical protein